MKPGDMSNLLKQAAASTLSGAARASFAMIMIQSDAAGKVFMSAERLGEYLGACSRTARRAIKELEAEGWIEVDRSQGRASIWKVARGVTHDPGTPDTHVTHSGSESGTKFRNAGFARPGGGGEPYVTPGTNPIGRYVPPEGGDTAAVVRMNGNLDELRALQARLGRPAWRGKGSPDGAGSKNKPNDAKKPDSDDEQPSEGSE